MCFHQLEHKDNVDFMKTLTALIKVYKQHARPYGYCKGTTSYIKKLIAKVVDEAKEPGCSLLSDEVPAVETMKE